MFAASVALVVTDLKRIIAYSTISQIGYMIMARLDRRLRRRDVPPHDARLLQGADVHGGRVGDRRDGRPPGHRRHVAACGARCPFTFWTFLIAALALAAFPGFSGYFSKDEILAFAAERGGAYWLLYAAGTLAALMTAFYAFRIMFRVFGGEPNEEAREIESKGHLHADPVNPMTGEPEDTDVGYPGPEHHTAEHERPMQFAMVILAGLAVVAGVLQIPGVTHVVENFLHPTFEDSRFAETDVSGSLEALALVVGGAHGAGRHRPRLAAVRAPTRARRPRLARRLPRLHGFLEHKWYFDELYDRLVVRPGARAGPALLGRVRARGDRRHGVRHRARRAGRQLAGARGSDRTAA